MVSARFMASLLNLSASRLFLAMIRAISIAFGITSFFGTM